MKANKLQCLLIGVWLLLLSSCTWLSFLQKKVDWRTQTKPNLSNIQTWATYYGPYYANDVKDKLEKYDMVVLGWMDDRQSVPKQPIVFQYLAVVEAGPTHRQYYDWLADIDQSYRLFDNPDYPGAWVIDIRKQEWQDLIIDKAIPWTMDHGGQGLMLDTFGNIKLYLGNSAGYRQAAVELVKKIRSNYPNLALIVNEPGDLLPDIDSYIDGIIFEQYMADIRTGELYSQPRSSWGNAEVQVAIALRDSIVQSRNFLLMTCDMVKNNNSHESVVCVNHSLAAGLLPSLTPYSSLGKRYQTLSDQYWAIMDD